MAGLQLLRAIFPDVGGSSLPAVARLFHGAEEVTPELIGAARPELRKLMREFDENPAGMFHLTQSVRHLNRADHQLISGHEDTARAADHLTEAKREFNRALFTDAPPAPH